MFGTCVTRGDIRGLFAFILVWVAFFINPAARDMMLRPGLDALILIGAGLSMDSAWIWVVVILGVLKVHLPGGGERLRHRSAEPIQAMIDQILSGGRTAISWESSLQSNR
jgi:hypothetical protein